MFNEINLNSYGIVDWGYTDELSPASYDRFDDWIKQKRHGSLSYLSDHRKVLRKSLTCIREDAKSALVFLFDYHGDKLSLDEVYKDKNHNGLKMASYSIAFGGQDYHLTIAKYLNEIGSHLKNKDSDLDYSLSLDIHPVLERDLAYRAGLGWFGKNSMMISKEHGSFFLIGSLILNKKLEVAKKTLESDHCGQCRSCVDACPTQAIDIETRTIIANQCIPNYTIETFSDTGEAPDQLEKAEGEFFGCDICQDICPWNNRKLLQSNVQKVKFQTASLSLLQFYLLRPLAELVTELESWSNKGFKRKMVGTSLERTGRIGILKNINFWKKYLK